MVMNYENLLFFFSNENLVVIALVTDFNLKKFGVGWFERVLEIEFCKMVEMN